MTRPPFPSVVDSTIIAAFRSCPQKAYLEFVEHWKIRDQSVHLVAGAAYAAGMEAAAEWAAEILPARRRMMASFCSSRVSVPSAARKRHEAILADSSGDTGEVMAAPQRLS